MQDFRQEHRSFMSLFGVSLNLLNDAPVPACTLWNEAYIKSPYRVRAFPEVTHRNLNVLRIPRVHHRHAHINLRLSVGKRVVFRSHRVQGFVSGSEEFVLVLEEGEI